MLLAIVKLFAIVCQGKYSKKKKKEVLHTNKDG